MPVHSCSIRNGILPSPTPWPYQVVRAHARGPVVSRLRPISLQRARSNRAMQWEVGGDGERCGYLVLLQAGEVLFEELVELLADLLHVDRVVQRVLFLACVCVCACVRVVSFVAALCRACCEFLNESDHVYAGTGSTRPRPSSPARWCCSSPQPTCGTAVAVPTSPSPSWPPSGLSQSAAAPRYDHPLIYHGVSMRHTGTAPFCRSTLRLLRSTGWGRRPSS